MPVQTGRSPGGVGEAAAIPALTVATGPFIGRAREVGDVAATEKSVAELQHARREGVLAAIRTQVTEMLECQHQPSCSRARETRPARDLRERGTGSICTDAAQHREPAGQRLHEIPAVLERGVGHGLTPGPAGPSLVRIAVICAIIAQPVTQVKRLGQRA